MSGIVGIFFLDGRPVAPDDLERMIETISHRGPDGCGRWQEEAVGLGHLMLWTTHESRHEKPPLANSSGDLRITADARLDNREELLPALAFPPTGTTKITDSQLILAAYEKWGERCPEKLLGDFAFAIWDRRRQVLFCARDHFGVRPFFYYHSPGRLFTAASQIRAILCLPEVPRQLNETRVAYYLVGFYLDQAITFYQGILRLPPGHCLSVGAKHFSVRPYWSLDPGREIRYPTDEEYVQGFRELFTEAVRCRLRRAFPVGSMLSGGLDTSSIVCMARHLLLQERSGNRLHTFSVSFNDLPAADESPYFKTVVAQGGFEAHFIPREEIDPGRDFSQVMEHEDEPLWAQSTFLHWHLNRIAREYGVRVLFDGLEGDATVFHGMEYITELARAGRLLPIAREVVRLPQRHSSLSLSTILWRFIISPLAPPPAVRFLRALRGRGEPPWLAGSCINPEFARRVGLPGRLESRFGDKLRPPRTVKEAHYRSLNQAWLAYCAEMFDRASAAFAIESRHPLLDKRLAEFCLALPAEQKLRRGWTRWILRQAMAGILPEKVRWRTRINVISPAFVRATLTCNGGSLLEVIAAQAGGGILERFVDLGAVIEAYRRYLARQGPTDADMVWSAAQLALWFRRHGIEA